MKTVPWEDAAASIIVDVPGCELAMCMLKLKECARDFFTFTKAWSRVCDPLVTIQNLQAYDILDVRHAEGVALTKVYVDRRKITLLTPALFRDDAIYANGPGMPTRAAWIDEQLWLTPTPSVSGWAIAATLALRPKPEASGLPEDMWTKYIDHMVLGTKARLYSSPQKPYTDSGLAQLALAQYMDARSWVQIDAERGSADTSDEVKPHWF